MIQEAVLDEREGDRYIGFLVEQEDWHQGVTLGDDGFDAPDVLMSRKWIWRIVDRLTGNATEGPILVEHEHQAGAAFEQVWNQFNNSPHRPPVPETPITPANPYADHPNYGRF